MTRRQSVNLLGGSYDDDAKAWSTRRTVNWIPEIAQAPGTRTPMKLRTAPGLRPFAEVPGQSVRGSHDVEGRLFVVIGNRLYRMSPTGIAVPIGTIPGTGRVSMAHNQVAGGHQLVVANNQAGYVYNTATDTFQRIVDDAFPGASAVDFIDQYIVFVEPSGRYWGNSDLADALSYNALDRAEAEAEPDRIVTLKVSGNEVVVFGSRTTQFFQNTGQATGTFQSKGIYLNYGCAAAASVATLDNSPFWLDNTGRVVRLDSYAIVPISTVPIEQAIAGRDWKNAFGFAYESEGHKIYYLTFPDGLTIGYDVTTRLWHHRESFGIDRWRVNCLTYWNRRWIAGDFQSGRLYELDWEYPLEADAPLVRRMVSPISHADGYRIKVHAAELFFDAGQPPVEALAFPVQPPIPTISGAPPEGYQNRPYAPFSFAVSGGTGDLVVTLRSGPLPEGMALATSGALTGKPKKAGSFPLIVRVTDENGMWDEIGVSLVISNYVMAMVSEHNLFRGVPGGLQLSLPTNFSTGVIPESISVNPTATVLVAGFTSEPRLRVYELNDAGTAYLEVDPPDDQPEGNAANSEFSADGTYLCVGHSTPGGKAVSVYSYDGESFERTDQKVGTVDGTSVAKWAPDGNRLFWLTFTGPPDRGGRLYLFNKETGLLGTHKTVALAASVSAGNFSWSRDSKFLAMWGPTLDILGTSTSELQKVATAPGGYPDSYRGAWWSPDNEYVYTVSTGGNLVGSLAWDGANLTDPQYPAVQPGVFINASGLSGGGEYLAVSPSNTDPSIMLYEVSGGVLTLAATQPATTNINTNAIVWTPKP